MSPAQALAVAQVEAAKACCDLSPYSIRLSLEPDGWHVDYELKNKFLKGGGPHFIIDAATGMIVRRKYEQ